MRTHEIFHFREKTIFRTFLLSALLIGITSALTIEFRRWMERRGEPPLYLYRTGKNVFHNFNFCLYNIFIFNPIKIFVWIWYKYVSF